MDPVSVTTAVQMLGAAQNQQIGVAIARQQFTSDKAVAGLVAEGAQNAANAGPPAPPGQGLSVDLRV
ncbi:MULTISPECIES: hypothetical protein [unclassified Methylobacterium]|jgi:hypothetical protein|uniref:hypothetical protein n=1 Tax=unclassified Methylobacterium TaxID=2615210 RepID=UPI00135448BC|nr:hypothetical protein [Methylobacterium sp. 2A]MWV25866.1 hypothetical protein [Methylobacterium sp. 2A]